ncbi:MAG TPA: FtsQ-type POTRA domain-containing protein [Acidimicrobiales bacterium]|nr:FtsQ-type POTRA domain-containing protein [Acidimicrobiales bacterium]
MTITEPPQTSEHDDEVTAPAAPPVDPRFRARRIAVRRDEGRRRLKRLLLLVAVAALALAAVVVLRSPVLDVDEVTVTGAARLDPDQLREVAGIGVGRPLLLADLDGATERIRALPWVAEAEVTRDLPGTVVVSVREREPVAVVSGGGEAVLVDARGRVLAEPTAADGPQVQVVVGDAPPAPGRSVDPALRSAIDLAGRLRGNPVGAVTAVLLSPLRLQLVEGGVVELGDDTDLDAKVEAFRTVYARVDRACLARIDLTVPTHPVLTREPC